MNESPSLSPVAAGLAEGAVEDEDDAAAASDAAVNSRSLAASASISATAIPTSANKL